MTTGERRVILVGKIGAGKSATGNTILMRKRFQVGTATDEFSLRYAFNKVTQKSFKVLDTPGIGAANEDKLEKGYALQRAILNNVQNPHVILLVFDPSDCRDIMELVNLLKGWFGNSVIDHIILVFTKRKVFETDREFAEFLRYDERFDLTKVFRNRIIGIENHGEGRSKYQRELLNMIESTTLNGNSVFRLVPKPYFHFEKHTQVYEEGNDHLFICREASGSKNINWQKSLNKMPTYYEKENEKPIPPHEDTNDCIEIRDEITLHGYEGAITKDQCSMKMSPTPVSILQNDSPVGDFVRKPLTAHDILQTFDCAKETFSCFRNMKDDPIESLLGLALIASDKENIEAVKNVINSEEVQFLVQITASFVEQIAAVVGNFVQEIANEIEKNKRRQQLEMALKRIRYID